jgi:hypothetical protein
MPRKIIKNSCLRILVVKIKFLQIPNDDLIDIVHQKLRWVKSGSIILHVLLNLL